MPKRELAPRTVSLYADCERRFRVWLQGADPSLEGAEMYLKHLERRGLKRNTRHIIAMAIRRNCSIPVPSPGIEVPEPEYNTMEEIETLIANNSGPLTRTAFIVTFDTGCRISELLDMRVSRLDLERRLVKVTRKGGREENLALGQRSVDALSEWLKVRQSDDDLIFMDYTIRDIAYRMCAVARKCRIHFHPHMLRHSRAVHMWRSGMRLEEIAAVLGHKDLNVTRQIYARLSVEDRAKNLDQKAPW